MVWLCTGWGSFPEALPGRQTLARPLTWCCSSHSQPWGLLSSFLKEAEGMTSLSDGSHGYKLPRAWSWHVSESQSDKELRAWAPVFWVQVCILRFTSHHLTSPDCLSSFTSILELWWRLNTNCMCHIESTHMCSDQLQHLPTLTVVGGYCIPSASTWRIARLPSAKHYLYSCLEGHCCALLFLCLNLLKHLTCNFLILKLKSKNYSQFLHVRMTDVIH